MPERDVTLIPPGSFVVRVDPRTIKVPDLLHPAEPDQSLWLVEACTGDETVMSVEDLRERIAGLVDERYARLITDVHIMSALHLPNSPYGLAWPSGDDGGMAMIYQGWCYSRDPDGVLEPLGTWADGWPRPRQWRRARFAARLWAIRNGIQVDL